MQRKRYNQLTVVMVHTGIPFSVIWKIPTCLRAQKLLCSPRIPTMITVNFVNQAEITKWRNGSVRLDWNSTTVIAKIKEMLRSLFYDIPCYVTMDYEKWYSSLLLTTMWGNPRVWRSKSCQLHVDYTFQINVLNVDHVYFVLACKKSI